MASDGLSAYVQWVPLHEDEWNRLKSRFHLVALEKYSGDWNMGSGTWWIGYEGDPYIMGALLLIHRYSDNNPFSRTHRAEALRIDTDGPEWALALQRFVQGIAYPEDSNDGE